MPRKKKWYIQIAAVVTALTVLCLFVIPWPHKAMLTIVGYLGLMLVIYLFQKDSKKVNNTIRTLDAEKKYYELIDYIEKIATLGYKGFVIDSYVLYSYYVLGDFYMYEKTVLRMREYRQWTRPKFEDLRNKIRDNLACMALLKHMADTGEVVYKGSNLMMLQAVGFYNSQQFEELQSMLVEYKDIPKLKKAVIYVLLSQFEVLENYYESEVARKVISDIKEKVNNG